MEYKRLTFLTIAFLLCDNSNGKSKDPDEDRAYEFGFTIEGMQHRHEKKDVNGIIQGEFGFITADGVYHVTVYATDENGNFRILSMKNIKVSPPLDGSPDLSGTKYSTIPKTQQSPQQAKPPKSSLQPVQVQKRTDVSTTHKPFSLQPTIKPACAGCGYVTTSKKPPVSSDNSFNINSPSSVSNPSGPGAINGNIQSSGGFNSGQLPQSVAQITPTPLSVSKEIQPPKSNGIPGSPSQPLLPLGGDIRPGSPGSLGSNPNSFSNQPITAVDGNLRPGSPGSPPSYSDSFSNPQDNQNDIPTRTQPNKHVSQITYRNPESPVKVSDGVIKIPGNPDIPIKDKYPGMVDGLPAGIKEGDITDILYRFNWTVGFQGHYETGYKNGAKVGGYFSTSSDGISRIVTYVADENGYRPKVKIINLGLDSPDTPKDDKTFELKSFEFVWYPVK